MLTTADLFISGDRELCLSLLWLVGVYEQTDDYTWLLHAQTGECERRRKSLFSKKLSSIEIHASSSLCLQCFTSHHLVLRLRLLVTLVCIVNHFCAVFFFFFKRNSAASWLALTVFSTSIKKNKVTFFKSCLFNFPSQHWTVKSDTKRIFKAAVPGMKLLTCQINGCSNLCLCIDGEALH